MSRVLDIDEPQRQTFIKFLKKLPYVKVVSENDPSETDKLLNGSWMTTQMQTTFMMRCSFCDVVLIEFLYTNGIFIIEQIVSLSQSLNGK